jgi:hypothetical protein
LSAIGTALENEMQGLVIFPTLATGTVVVLAVSGAIYVAYIIAVAIWRRVRRPTKTPVAIAQQREFRDEG